MTVTTNEHGQQNMFAREPQMYIDPTIEDKIMREEYETHNEKAELLNGRFAMMGIIAALGAYAVVKLFLVYGEMAGRGNPKGTNQGGGPRRNACTYHARPDGTVWVERKKICKRVGFKHHSGYMYFSHGSRGEVAVHRFIAETFIPNPENKKFVDHINRIRDDNRVENLRWTTRKENNDNRCFGSVEAMIDTLTNLGYTIIPPDTNA